MWELSSIYLLPLCLWFNASDGAKVTTTLLIFYFFSLWWLCFTLQILSFYIKPLTSSNVLQSVTNWNVAKLHQHIIVVFMLQNNSSGTKIHTCWENHKKGKATNYFCQRKWKKALNLLNGFIYSFLWLIQLRLVLCMWSCQAQQVDVICRRNYDPGCRWLKGHSIYLRGRLMLHKCTCRKEPLDSALGQASDKIVQVYE